MSTKGKIEKVEAWRTTDGKVHKYRAKATRHQRNLDFDKFYKDRVIPGNYAGSTVELCDIRDWLTEHRDDVLAFYGIKED